MNVLAVKTAQRTSGPFGDSRFKYYLIAPAIFVMLSVALFPLINLLVVIFQGI